MAISTTTGTGTMTCRLVSSGTNIPLPTNTTTSLLQAASETVTTTGGHVAFLFRTATTNDSWCQLSLQVDGTEVYNASAGIQDSLNLPLASGSHTVVFNAFVFNGSITMIKCGLTVLDLGL